jgi:single-strand DNA-binding protein
MNSFIIKGRLTADPELKTTTNATEYCDFTVAVDRYAGKDKEKETDFVPCRAWRQTAVFIDEYFKKGQEILVSGEMRFDKYEKDGEKRTFACCTVNRAEFCGGKREANQTAETPSFRNSADVQNMSGFQAVDDGDLPF